MVLDDDDSVSRVMIADLPDVPGDDLLRAVRFHGHRSGGYLGVRSIEMTPELRQHFGAPRDAGVLVGTVEPESPAAKAGIQVGDILTAVDGEGVGSTRALSRSVRRHKDGDTVKVDLLRDRSKKTLAVTIKEVEGPSGDKEIRIGEFGHGPHGFAWQDWERAWKEWDRSDRSHRFHRFRQFRPPPPGPLEWPPDRMQSPSSASRLEGRLPLRRLAGGVLRRERFEPGGIWPDL